MPRIALALIAATMVTVQPLGAQQASDSTLGLTASRAWLRDSILGVGAAGAWLRLERGFTVGTLDQRHDALNDAPSLARAIQGRLPGVTVSQGEGFIGSESRVWLRGPNSVFVNEPLLIIDGARTHAPSGTRAFDLAALPSRLEDIDPEIIERIEVLRGAAASAIYGPGASKGVIVVTTKRGHAGPARWSAFAETGPLNETTDFPANFGTTGISTSTSLPVANCPLSAQAAGSCTPVTRSSWNPLESASPFRTGWSSGAGLNVSGGAAAGQLTYRASVGHDRATGVYRRDEGSATNASANIGLQVMPAVEMRFIGAYRTEELRHPTADYLLLGLRGSAVDDPVRRGYGLSGSGGAEEVGRRDEGDRRVTGAVHATWQARSWLRGTAMIGYDRLRSADLYRERQPGLTVPGIPSSGDSTTFINRTKDAPEARTGSAELEAMYGRFGARLRSAVGFQYLRDDDRGETFSASIPDTPGDPAFQQESFATVRRITKGIYARQHFSWDRVFLTGSMRVDKPSEDLFGTLYSPSVDVSWMPIRTTDGVGRGVDELRLRAAYGRGGGHLIPTLRANPGPGGLRVAEETAERMSEIEVGADVALLGERVLAQITAYRATNDQGLVQVPAAVSSGFQTYISNQAEYRTGGVEIMIDALLLERGSWRWDAGLGIARHSVRTENAAVPQTILGTSGQSFRDGDGIADYHSAPYTWIDQNGDDLIARSEITESNTEFPSVGSPFPEYEASLHTNLAFGRSIRVSALLDRRAGQKLYNNTARQRCSFNPNCEDQHDPATPLAEQAAAAAAQDGNVGGYIEDASFTRLREVKLSFTLPQPWTGSASSARISLTGRNLYTWTGYSGLDPEITSRDRDGIIASDSFFQPPLRSFTARLELIW